jgi:hypothetical protein
MYKMVVNTETDNIQIVDIENVEENIETVEEQVEENVEENVEETVEEKVEETVEETVKEKKISPSRAMSECPKCKKEMRLCSLKYHLKNTCKEVVKEEAIKIKQEEI